MSECAIFSTSAFHCNGRPRLTRQKCPYLQTHSPALYLKLSAGTNSVRTCRECATSRSPVTRYRNTQLMGIQTCGSQPNKDPSCDGSCRRYEVQTMKESRGRHMMAKGSQ